MTCAVFYTCLEGSKARATAETVVKTRIMSFRKNATMDHTWFKASKKELDIQADFLSVLTKERWHMATERPMARGPEPARSDRELSQVANTVMTSTKVMRSSMAKP